ncbi:MAG: hypothetical protein EB157_04830 [Euryarchaeota archaeon]|nr:hypothetical protein [Euryarchaeota archaeon]
MAKHFDSSGHIPSERLITIEDRDEALVINCCQGSRINETIGHFLLAMASTRMGKWGRLIVEPCRISLRIPGIRPAELIEWLMDTPPDALEGVLSVTLPNSREVRWRFAQVGKVFGILKKGVDPRRINLQALIKKYRGTPVMEEVLGKLFYERMDIEGSTDVLRAIQSGLTCMREGLEKQLVEMVKSDEVKDRDRMMKNAQVVSNRGMEAILALMGRGVGEATCQRLMRKVPRGDSDRLLEAIHIAEIEYARTRRFWG